MCRVQNTQCVCAAYRLCWALCIMQSEKCALCTVCRFLFLHKVLYGHAQFFMPYKHWGMTRVETPG